MKRLNVKTAMSFLFPHRCPLCGTVSETVMCADCASSYPVVHYSVPLLGTVRAHAVFAYRGQIRVALLALKFGGRRGRAEGFGQLMAQCMADGTYDCVAYVPMNALRQMRRGYNQAELLAKACARAMHLPCRSLLRKTRRTATQHTLPTPMRIANVCGAYRSRPLHGERVLLCDDIMTTGATLRACSDALFRAGAGSVETICIAWSRSGCNSEPNVVE